MYLLLNLLASIVVPGVIPVTVIFGLAGRWDLWNVWSYAGISVLSLILQTLVIYRRSPDLLKARMTDGGGRVRLRADRAFIVLSLFQWILAGLDQRYQWSTIFPPMEMIVGLVVVALSWGLTTWSVWFNPFFSPAVRIQEERSQRLISLGPYTIVRHPGYLGIALSMVASAVALNSLLSIIPAVMYMAVTVHQTTIEDQMLRDELTGYADYAAKVRYRLIPGVW
jgi:protein-S-isoprenylcysteine O-methyltransferase Ste14